jgi:NADPH:quinone reductase-like Zn-dependent oxidoreductase
MRAVQFSEFGEPEKLNLVELPEPQLEGKQALIKMRFAAINPLDNTVRAGHLPYAKNLPLVPGNEGAGIVVKSGQSGLEVGTRVMVVGSFGVTRPGTWQEYVAAEPYELLPIPPTVSDSEAAAFPIAFLTAQLALMEGGSFKANDTLLAPAVGGSIGNSVIQLALAQGAAKVITTAGSTRKAQLASEKGYTNIIDLSQEDLQAGVKRLTDNAGVDLAIDSVGGHLSGQLLASLKPKGTLVIVGYTAGVQATINIPDLTTKKARIVGLWLDPTSPYFSQALETVLRLLTEGRVKPAVARIFPISEAVAAQRYQIEDRPFGKVLLSFETGL